MYSFETSEDDFMRACIFAGCPTGCARCSWDSGSSSLTCDTAQCSGGYAQVDALECISECNFIHVGIKVQRI
jgi:hypothetical protein